MNGEVSGYTGACQRSTLRLRQPLAHSLDSQRIIQYSSVIVFSQAHASALGCLTPVCGWHAR